MQIAGFGRSEAIRTVNSPSDRFRAALRGGTITEIGAVQPWGMSGRPGWAAGGTTLASYFPTAATSRQSRTMVMSAQTPPLLVEMNRCCPKKLSL